MRVQTAAIGYRVVDFLKQHPPFNSIEEPDLLTLVSRGRVKFHESDEFLCWQKSSYTPFILVIQQGAVSLWEEIDGKELLRDVRGPGDIIGVERFLGSEAYPYSAKSNGEVVVYALQAADFEPLLARYPQAKRYVDAHAAAGAIYRDPARQGVHEKFVAELARHSEPLWCRPDSTVAEAAQILRTANADAIAVVLDEKLDGLLTVRDVVGWAADGASASETVQHIMSVAPPPVAPQTSISDCVLAMSRADSNFVALTVDGTPGAVLLRLLSAADLQPAFGDNPLAILREIAHASGIESLRLLHLRARAFLLTQLSEPSAVDWLAAFADRINIGIATRLTELAGNANNQWTWCFWGAAGRCELIAPLEPETALICRETADITRAQQALQRLRADLTECGYIPHAAPDFEDEMLCGTVSTWQERLAEWIRNPIWTMMYRARPLFDLRPAWGDAEAWQLLEQSAREVIRGEPSFQQVLANDCMSELPPLTFFQDAVVDESGERSEVFALQLRALGPIVEVGRVFGLANQRVLGSSTLERLELARSRMPAQESIFREAMETLRVLLYLQARTGLRLNQSGADILPAQLSRLDRQALKSGFRAIHNLLEFTVNRVLRESS
ncbi:MAG: putative nucleotidyltransferase substrate binding domain-containing protein [Acidobacteriota bacterium]